MFLKPLQQNRVRMRRREGAFVLLGAPKNYAREGEVAREEEQRGREGDKEGWVFKLKCSVFSAQCLLR